MRQPDSLSAQATPETRVGVRTSVKSAPTGLIEQAMAFVRDAKVARLLAVGGAGAAAFGIAGCAEDTRTGTFVADGENNNGHNGSEGEGEGNNGGNEGEGEGEGNNGGNEGEGEGEGHHHHHDGNEGEGEGEGNGCNQGCEGEGEGDGGNNGNEGEGEGEGGTYNPGTCEYDPNLPDTDGDRVTDDRDTCPFNPDILVTNPDGSCGGSNADGDNCSDACDPQPTNPADTDCGMNGSDQNGGGEQQQQPTAEICDDEVDNDMDGQVDERPCNWN